MRKVVQAMLNRQHQMKSITMQSYAMHRYNITKHALLYNLKQGNTCALLGFPGTGKTTMTADIVQSLSKEGQKVVITGSTGAAPQPLKQILENRGLSVKVQTIHSLLCLTPDMSTLIEQNKLDRVERHMTSRLYQGHTQASKELLAGCSALIIEEISMISGNFMHAIDICLRVLQRRPTQKFGGLTLLLVGDFRQLPPVSCDKTKLFYHRLWKKWVDEIFNLEMIFRQQEDWRLTNIIHAMSFNSLTEDLIALLQTRVIEGNGCSKIFDSKFLPEALRIFDTNQNVNKYNECVAKEAVEAGLDHKSLCSILVCSKEKKQTRTSCLKENSLNTNIIFEGAKVVITSNIDTDKGLVNGTRATVVAFLSTSSESSTERCGCSCFNYFVTVLTESGLKVNIGCHPYKTKKGEIHSIPLNLFYAVTVHKLQGQTTKQPIFYMPSQKNEVLASLYVACTRVPCLDFLYFTHLPTAITKTVDPQVLEWYATL